MIRTNVINGVIVLGKDNNDLLTMRQMTLSEHENLMRQGLEVFNIETAIVVDTVFAEVNPYFETEEDRSDAYRLLLAKYREVPGTTGIYKDPELRSHESR